MFNINPSAELSGLIPPIAMQIYVILMAILVAGGTLLDTIHKKSAQYFFENSEKQKKMSSREVSGGEKVGIAVKTVAVDAHSKASNVKNISEMIGFALEPVYNRPLRENPHAIAGLEMTRYMFETCTSAMSCAEVAAKNMGNAMHNPHAAFGAAVCACDAHRQQM